MSTSMLLQQRVDDYLAERRRLGFKLQSLHGLLSDFATFVAERHDDGPLSVALMAEWAQQAKGGQGTRETWWRRLARLRPFLRYLRQFEPLTEIPAYSAETGQPFQRKLDTCSAANWTAVPDETGHSERSDAWDGCYVRAGGHLRQCLVMRTAVSV